MGHKGFQKLLAFVLLLGPLYSFAQAPGTLDAAFGQQGVVLHDIDNFDDVAAAESDDNDRIFVLSQTGHNTGNGFDMDYSLNCFLSDGSADVTFGQAGNVTADFAGFDYANPYALAIQPDGKVLVLGKGSSTGTSGVEPFCLVRYTENGALDNSFGTNGEVQLNFLGDVEAPRTLELQLDGKIIVAGATFDSAAIHEELPCIARLLPDGTLDTSFGNSGKIAVDFSNGIIDANALQPSGSIRHDNGGYFESILIKPDGTLLCAGSYFNGQTYQSLVMSINSNGTIDANFAMSGLLTFDLAPGHNSTLVRGAMKPDGSIAYLLRKDGSATDHDFYLLGMDETGMLEPLMDLDIHGNQNFAEAIAFTPEGALLVAGRGIDPINYAPTYNSDFFEIAQVGDWMNAPQIDLSFANDGIVSMEVHPSLPCGARAMTLLSDGSIIVVGFTETTDSVNTRDIALIKLHSGSTYSSQEIAPAAYEIAPFPNPSEGLVHFDIREGETLLTCSLYDSAGRIVMQGTSGRTGRNFDLDCSEMPAGQYYIQVVTSDDEYSATVLISR